MSETEQIKVTINGTDFETAKGSRLIDVCREKGFGIPSFCYYKDLALQASCRMCLVRIEKMPKLQTACTIICTDGMVVTTDSEEVQKAQRAGGEFLLANHPLDCPVCDRGGECELQEVVFDWGDLEERFVENKNVTPDKYLSPVIANDPQRCILCKRCTRVCTEWMGEDAIEAGNRGVATVIGTYGGWLNCSQCGNCVEVCPTGTLLDAVYRHETRTWELDQTTTTDVYSSDGMQISIGSREGVVHRVVARDRYVNGINGEFLDVKARYAHGFVNHADRLKTPLIRYQKGGKLIPATWDAAVKFAAERLSAAGKDVGVVASPRLTNEAIFTLRKFAEAAGSTNVAVSDPQDLAPVFDNLSVPLATHKEIRYASVIVVIGGEPEEEQTFTAKQVRQAVRNSGAKLFIVSEMPTNLEHQTRARHIHLNVGTQDAFALAFADSKNDKLAAEKGGIDAAEIEAVRNALNEAKGDVVIMIGGDLSPEAQAVIARNAVNFVGEGRRALIHPLATYNNSVGANDVMQGRISVEDAVKNAKALLIGGSLQDAGILKNKDFIAVQELFMTETAELADVVFPAASFAEIDGTFTNNAGNVQRVRRAIEPTHQSKADWMITALVAREMGRQITADWSASAIFRELADTVPAYSGLRYPAMKDETNPARAVHICRADTDISQQTAALLARIEAITGEGAKNNEKPKIGHKLFRLTTMTSKTPQFHLLAAGNPKPMNLMLAPLEQFDLDGVPTEKGKAEAAAIGAADRALVTD
ncbi:MAG: molybdopterin-dependent oxidoreductase [Chloracidobacterium sp.]|nr:molybdopterin-dependent oxidoreductase [Chloracidobacterium sp.]MCO5334403.1 molybdopterin-dependent oxidoreductase [Pyrinomonadaceae bacterium]